MDPTRSLRSSLSRLRRLQFHRYEQCSGVVRDWFRLRAKIDRHLLSAELWRIHDWVVAPLTLQALDYLGLAQMIVALVRRGSEFDADLMFLLQIIDPPPSPKKVAAMIVHEMAVAEGLY